MNSTSQLVRLNRFKQYFLWFSILGQNSSYPLAMQRKRFINYIPSIVTLIIVICSEHMLILKEFKRVERNQGVFLHSAMLINMMPSLSAVFESFRIPKGTAYLVKSFSTVIEYVEEKTLAKIDWEQFQKQIWFKNKWILIFYFITVFFRLWLRSPIYGRVYETSSAILGFFRIISVLHLVFYIDLLTFLHSTISSVVYAHAKAIRYRLSLKSLNQIINILNDVKYQHFKLWQCTQIFNKYFGWIIVIDVVDSAFSITYDGYWLFFSISIYGKNLFLHLRNYILFVMINVLCICFSIK